MVVVKPKKLTTKLCCQTKWLYDEPDTHIIKRGEIAAFATWVQADRSQEHEFRHEAWKHLVIPKAILPEHPVQLLETLKLKWYKN